MHKLILNYLSSFYWGDSHHDLVHEHDSHRKIYGKYLREDVIDMFNVSDIMATACIEIWLYDEGATFDINKFWEDYEFYGLLPIAMQVAARTVGMDLVSVQPLSAPNLDLMYLGFQYDAQTAVTQSMGIPSEMLGQDTQVTFNDDDESLSTYRALDAWRHMNVEVPVNVTNISGITYP